MKMCDNTGDPFIALLHNVRLAPDLRDRLFFIIVLMSLGHISLLHKRFCIVYFRIKEKNIVTLPNSAQSKQSF